MTDFIQAIENLLQQYCETITDNRLELKEKQAKTGFTIIESPDDGLKFSIPAGGKAHSGIVQNVQNYRRSCDFLIIAPHDKKNIDVYFVEIKETLSPDKNGIPIRACDQIRFTVPVWEYLNSMVQIHFGVRHKIRKHFVVLARKNRVIDKLPIKFRQRSPINERRYKGENFKIIHSLEEISFKDLK